MANYTLKSLEESGLYSQELLSSLKSKQFSALKKLPSTYISNPDFMLPLLHAVKNELGTYEVYLYMGDNLQREPSLAKEILKDEPEIFSSSPLSSDKLFILNNIQSIPNLANHMHPSLKADSGFIDELCQSVSPEIAKQIIEETQSSRMSPSIDVSSELVNDAVVASIIADPQNMDLLTEEQKNDYMFISDIVDQNPEAIGYIVNNIDEFGENGIRAATDGNQRIIIDTFNGSITDEVKESSPIKNIDNLVEGLENPEDPAKAIATIGAIKFLNGNMTIEEAQQIVNQAVLSRQSAKLHPESIKEGHTDGVGFVAPQVLDAAIGILKEKGIEIPEGVQELLKDYDEVQKSTIDSNDRMSPDYMDKENEFYNEQEERLAKEAEAAGVPVEEYSKTHFILYERYLERAKVSREEYEASPHTLSYEEYLYGPLTEEEKQNLLEDEVDLYEEQDIEEAYELEDVKDATSDTRSEEVEEVTGHVKDSITRENDSKTDEIDQGEI